MIIQLNRKCVIPRRFVTVSAILLFIVAFAATVSPGMNPVQAIDAINITLEQNGETIVARQGTIVKLELPEVGSSGYVWHCRELDSDRIELLTERSVTGLKHSNTGNTMTHVYEFILKKIGRTVLELECYREWEGIGKSVARFDIRVVIEASDN